MFLWTGCLDWGRHVCSSREKDACHTRRFWNGGSKGNDEERNGKEQVAQEVVEVNVYYTRHTGSHLAFDGLANCADL